MLAAHDRIVRAYLEAKDYQRPHRFAEAFTDDARFRTTFAFDTDWNSSDAVHGLPAITETFRRLGAGFENLVTFCLPESLRWEDDALHMRWVVFMTGRKSGQIRVAWGDYQWRFTAINRRATSLDVHMHAMRELPSNPRLLDWAMALPHVWCTGAVARRCLPHAAIPGLSAFLAGEASESAA